MNKFKLMIARRFFKELLPKDASGSSGGATGRELANQVLKRVVYKDNNDVDFEDPSFELTDIQDAYNKDAYVRQGVDKYVDQIFKEGYQFYGADTNTVDYLKQRLAFIAEATSTPTSQLLMDIAEDVVKYANCMVVKARSNDPNAFPQGVNIQGLYGKDPVAGYFCANATVTISKSYQRLKGKDVITTPKTKKSNRVIKMPKFLCGEMEDYLKMFYSAGADERIFPVSKHYLHHEMDRGAKAAGVKRIRIHDLRHSHISLLIDMGFTALAIADRVGHESIDITYRYAHLFPTRQTEMADKLDFERMGT